MFESLKLFVDAAAKKKAKKNLNGRRAKRRKRPSGGRKMIYEIKPYQATTLRYRNIGNLDSLNWIEQTVPSDSQREGCLPSPKGEDEY